MFDQQSWLNSHSRLRGGKLAAELRATSASATMQEAFMIQMESVGFL
jgi:hypothetical protein